MKDSIAARRCLSAWLFVAAVIVAPPAIWSAEAPRPTAAEPAPPPSFPVDPFMVVTVGAGPSCPVAVVGRQVWDLRQRRVQATLDGDYYPFNPRTALSPDGRYFAAAVQIPKTVDTFAAVWTTADGKRVLQLPAERDHSIDLLLFFGDHFLAVGGQRGNGLRLWDLRQAKSVRTIDLSGRPTDHGRTAVSADGTTFVSPDFQKQKLALYKMSTGQPIAYMGTPRDMYDGPTQPGPPRNAAEEARRYEFGVILSIVAISYSPDGKEIAAYANNIGQGRLLAWDLSGKVLYDERLDMPPSAKPVTLVWAPDGTGWLVNGTFVDRKLKRNVLTIHHGIFDWANLTFFDADHLAGVFSGTHDQFRFVAIPREQIRKAVSAMSDPKASLMGPAQPVSVKADFAGQLRGDPTQAVADLTDAMIRRLKRDGIAVMPGSDVVVHLRLSESAGDVLPIYQRESILDRRGTNTGRTIAESKGNLVVELTARGEPAPLWRETIEATSARNFLQDINNGSLRKSMLTDMTSRIGELQLPYFIPRDKSLPSLPMILQ